MQKMQVLVRPSSERQRKVTLGLGCPSLPAGVDSDKGRSASRGHGSNIHDWIHCGEALAGLQ